eukprot:scaffold36160_cov45-Phaeocystis_antarctica.AAC.2
MQTTWTARCFPADRFPDGVPAPGESPAPVLTKAISAKVSRAAALPRVVRQHIDGVARASSAGTKSGSSARSLVLLTILASVRREPHGSRYNVQGPATARRRSELENRRPLYGGQLSSPP